MLLQVGFYSQLVSFHVHFFLFLLTGLHKHMEGLTNDVERSNEMVCFPVLFSFIDLLGSRRITSYHL